MKVCPNCGTQADDGAFFCPTCQADLPASSIVQEQPPEVAPYDPYAAPPQYPGQQPASAQYAGPGYYPPGMDYQVQTPLDSEGYPLGASKFAWGALLFGWIWCAVYGLWAFLAIDLALSALSGFLNAFAEDSTLASALSGALGFASLGWRVFLGFIGPKTFWKQYPHKYSVERWNRHQRNWGIAAIIYFIVVCLCVAAVAVAVVSYARSGIIPSF